MESAKQRIRVAATRQKEETRAKEAGGETSSTPKVVTKQAKRKPDESESVQKGRHSWGRCCKGEITS